MNTLKEPIRTSVPLTAEKGERCEPVLKLTRILVPMDFSKTCEKALDYAVPLAREFGATITVLHAIEPPRWTLSSYLPGEPTSTNSLVYANKVHHDLSTQCALRFAGRVRAPQK